MKASEHYACLSYATIDFLFPQKSILKTLWLDDGPCVEEDFFCLDEYAKLFLRQLENSAEENENVAKEHKSRLEIIINQDGKALCIHSTAVPSVTDLFFDDFCVIKGFIGEKLEKKGIAGYRMNEGKIQFLIDTDKFGG